MMDKEDPQFSSPPIQLPTNLPTPAPTQHGVMPWRVNDMGQVSYLDRINRYYFSSKYHSVQFLF